MIFRNFRFHSSVREVSFVTHSLWQKVSERLINENHSQYNMFWRTLLIVNIKCVEQNLIKHFIYQKYKVIRRVPRLISTEITQHHGIILLRTTGTAYKPHVSQAALPQFPQGDLGLS